MRAGEIECVTDSPGLLLDDVMDVLAFQTGAYMLRDLPDEAVADDGDITDSGAPDGSQRVVDDRPSVQR